MLRSSDLTRFSSLGGEGDLRHGDSDGEGGHDGGGRDDELLDAVVRYAVPNALPNVVINQAPDAEDCAHGTQGKCESGHSSVPRHESSRSTKGHHILRRN
jgi:hypothetical protein